MQTNSIKKKISDSEMKKIIHHAININSDGKKEELYINIVRKNKQMITSYESFKSNMYNNNGEISGMHEQLHLFFSNLIKYLSQKYSNVIDPLEYLYFLYYECEISTIDIYDLFHSFGNYKNNKKDTFTCLFRNTLNWKLRKQGESTDLLCKKFVLTDNQKEQKDVYVNKVTKILQRLQREKEKQEVEKDVIKNSKTTYVVKIKHILNKRGYITSKRYNEIILKLSTKYGTNATASGIQRILEIEGFENIKMYPSSISKLKKKEQKTR